MDSLDLVCLTMRFEHQFPVEGPFIATECVYVCESEATTEFRNPDSAVYHDDPGKASFVT